MLSILSLVKKCVIFKETLNMLYDFFLVADAMKTLLILVVIILGVFSRTYD